MQGATSESPEAAMARTVTLEVTPAEAERVAVAVRLGHLSLSVVAVPQASSRGSETDRTPPQAGDGVTWGGDVSSALRGGPTSEGTTVRLFQGPTDSKELHF